MQGFNLLLLLLFSVNVFGAEKITVTIGQGRLSLQMPDLNLDDQSKREVETTLLMNKRLQNVIDSQEVRTIVLEGEAVDKIYKSLKLSKDQAQRQIKALVENQFTRTPTPSTDAVDQPAVIRTGETQVIMGSKFFVRNGEFLQQLVSFGSEVEVEGEVAELVAIGGKVTLKSGALISQELVTVGAELVQEDGSQIAKLTSGLQWHGIDHRFFGLRELGFWPLFWILFGKVIIWSLIGWLWFKAAPVFHKDVQKQLRTKPVASLFWTLFAILIFIPTAILLIVTIIGILFLPFLVLLYGLFWIMAEVHWARFISSRLPGLKAQSLLLQIFCGLIIFELFNQLIPYPFKWVPYLLLAVSFGAVFSQFLRRGIAWRN